MGVLAFGFRVSVYLVSHVSRVHVRCGDGLYELRSCRNSLETRTFRWPMLAPEVSEALSVIVNFMTLSH